MWWINVSDELPTLRIRKNMNAYIYESDRHLVYNGGPHVAILQKHVYKKVMFWIDASHFERGNALGTDCPHSR